MLGRALLHVDNAYFIPDFAAHGRIAKTNKTSQTAFRGFGGPQGMLVIEDVLGRVAPALGIDAATLRERNLYEPGQTTPYGQPVRHAERLRRIWNDLRESSDFDARRAEIAAFNAAHPDVKRALADHTGEVRDLVHPHRVQPGRARSCTSTRTARCS